MPRRRRFSALQRAENSSMSGGGGRRRRRAWFQCSSASRKFLNPDATVSWTHAGRVSVLFSEPKIPQSTRSPPAVAGWQGFSALQRAENSSIGVRPYQTTAVRGFQCSSASRKFLNPYAIVELLRVREFQCSSASRKFLNSICRASCVSPGAVSVLFSEPKIPQFVITVAALRFMLCFSALQRAENSSIDVAACKIAVIDGFSALQRAENSSIFGPVCMARMTLLFQCSSASRKFLNRVGSCAPLPPLPVSVLFSEPKIPQCFPISCWACAISCFSALQRAENSSIYVLIRNLRPGQRVSVLFSEPKIPQCSMCLTISARCEVSVLFSEPKIPQ